MGEGSPGKFRGRRTRGSRVGSGAQTDQASGQGNGPIPGQAFGGGHQVGIEGVRRTIAERLRPGRELSTDSLRRDTLEPSNPSPWPGVERFNPAIRAVLLMAPRSWYVLAFGSEGRHVD